MRYLRRFESTTILDEDIEKFFPKSLSIVTDRGEFDFKKTSFTREIDIIRVVYEQSKWGEPDYLEIDLHFVRKSSGLKILVDVTYGDFMASEFSIYDKNKVSIIHYNGVGSKQDKDTHFGFKNSSLQELIDLFNRFGFDLKISQFTFIDEDLDSFIPKDPLEKIPGVKESADSELENNLREEIGEIFQDFLDDLDGESIKIDLGRGSVHVKISHMDILKNKRTKEIPSIMSNYWMKLDNACEMVCKTTDLEFHAILVDSRKLSPTDLDIIFDWK